MTYYTKYLKYKNKYLNLKYYSGNMVGGAGVEYTIEDKVLYDPHSAEFLNEILVNIGKTNPTTLCIKNSSGLLASILSLIKTIRDDKIPLTKIYLEKFSSFTSGQDTPSEDSLKFLQMSILSSILTYETIKSIELVDIIFNPTDNFSRLEFKTMSSAPSNITELIIKNSTITYEQILELIYLCSKLQTVTISGCKYFDNVSNDFVNFNDFNNESFKDNYVFMRMKDLKEMKTKITITIS
jgi:hypothetical protein